MEGLVLSALKVFLSIFASVGIVYHLLVLKNPESGRRIEQKLGAELGVKKKFIPWLEENRLGLHDRLARNKTYNIFATIFLIVLLIFLFQM